MSKPKAEMISDGYQNLEHLIEENFSWGSWEEVEVLFVDHAFKCTNVDELPPGCKILVTPQTRTPNISDAVKERVRVISLEGDREFLSQLTATAEHTLGLIHALHRRIPAAHQSVLSGRWGRRDWPGTRMLSRSTLGILGYGRLGQMVEKLTSSLFEDINVWEPTIGHMGTFESVLQTSQILTIHLGLGYKDLIGAKELALMPKGALLVNTAQGSIIQLDALLDALESGHLGGAALDVLPNEPELPPRLIEYARSHDNLILTPHIGGSTLDSWEMTERRVIERAIEEIKNGSL